MNHQSRQRQHYALWLIWIIMMIVQHHVRGFLPVRRRHMMPCHSLIPQPQRAFTSISRDDKNGLAAKHNKRSKNSQNDDDDQEASILIENASSLTTRKALVSKQEDDDIFYTSELIIKKSKFLAFACPTPSWTTAQEHLTTIHTLHPKARHVCFAFCGDGTERCSDDGEPTGTAGLPILNAIKQIDLDNVLVAVVRYFGGIKLGAGGLIRAYGNAARQVLQDAPTEQVIPMSQFAIQVDIADMAVVYSMPSTLLQIVGPERYDHNNQVCIPVSCPTSNLQEVQDKILDATRGKATFVESTNNHDEDTDAS